MYFLIRLAQHLDTPNIVDGRWMMQSETQVEESNELICIDPASYHEIFIPDETMPYGYKYTLIEGFENEPKYTWDSSTRTFIPYTGFEQDSRVKAYRRRETGIQSEILYTIRPGTEFKKIRKCLKAIIDAIPTLKELPEVVEFMDYSGAIESYISRYPKEI